jgi:NAD(P)-dependent dehydrogenase (short-subunit alcohol dehydrogenase family)
VGELRTVVLTGATRGLGRALVAELHGRGHVVLGCGRDAVRVAELAGRYPAPCDFAAVDVTDHEAVRAWAERLMAAHGPPDLVIANAGLMNSPAPLWDVPAAEFDALMNVNLGGVASVVRAFVPAMVQAGRGVVVNLSSGWGRVTSPGVAPYCASKWGVEGLTRALAQDLPEGLAAVAVNPGIIATDMLRRAFGDGAASCESPESWAPRAADLLLRLGPRDNGASLTV